MRLLEEIEIDLHKALELLSQAEPNPKLVNCEEWWDENNKLMDKYCPESEET